LPSVYKISLTGFPARTIEDGNERVKRNPVSPAL
jgi:hypothetical protein